MTQVGATIDSDLSGSIPRLARHRLWPYGHITSPTLRNYIESVVNYLGRYVEDNAECVLWLKWFMIMITKVGR